MNINKEKLRHSIPVEQYYREYLGEPQGTIAGGRKYFCKFHDDRKTPNLIVRKNGRYKCFACNASGDIFDFYIKINNVSFTQAVQDLAEKYTSNLTPNNGNGNHKGNRNHQNLRQPTSEDAKRAAADHPQVKGLKEKGYEPTGLYEYHDPETGVVFWRCRMDHPKMESNPKWIKPLSFINGKWELKEPDFPDGKPLYLRKIEKNSASSNTVYLFEGEKMVDVAARLGLNGVTSGSCTSANKANWKPLQGNLVITWPDNDAPGRKYVETATDKLQALGVPVKWIDVGKLNLPVGGDICDWLEANPEAIASDIEALLKIEPEGSGKIKAEDDPQVWPEPDSIDTELLAVQPLPFEVLPQQLRPWIEDVSHRMQCPPDFVASAAIVLCGSLIGTKCGIKPKQNDDWLVVPNLWGGVVGRPSMLKTPSLAEALKPLGRLEAEAKESHDEVLKKHQADLLEWEARKDALKRDMKKATSGKDTKTIEKIKSELTELEKPESSAMTRYKSNDATIEKLSELLNENPNGLLLFRDELVGLLAGWEKPGRESDRAFFLEAWDGTGSHTTDRIGRGTTFTENLCLSLFGGIQPSKLTLYLLQMTGLENDGLIQRLQLLVYPDEMQKWQLVDEKPNRDARERAFSVIEKLATFNPASIGATKCDYDRFPTLRFCPEAQEVFNEWLTDLESKLRSDDHPLILEHLGKYRSLMPTLALIFHLIHVSDGGPAGPISLQSAEKAAAFCEYLESHARRVYGLVADINQQATALLAEKIKQGKLQDEFTVRDIQRKNWHLLNTKELAQASCNELIDAGWLKVRQQEKDGVGRPALPIHRINPKVKTKD